MDPAVPWTAYAAASYNRLANATAGGFQTAAGEFQNTTLAGHQTSAQSQSTTNQLLLQAAHTTATLAGQLTQGSTFTPTGFLSPPSVGYDPVFSPLFHHANTKAAAAHFRKQSGDSELTSLHPQGSYFDHSASATTPAGWTHQANAQLPSPFGILPHESVVANSPGSTKAPTTTAYENTFNAAQHFAAQSLSNHLGSHLSEFAKGKTAARTQHQAGAAYTSSQQSCIVSSASPNPGQNKADYRVPQTPTRGATNATAANAVYVNQRVPEKQGRNFVSPPGKVAQQQTAPQQAQQVPQQQHHPVATKAQAKIYPELAAQGERRSTENLEVSQSSPISFAISYPTNKSGQRSTTTTQYVVNQNYRYNEGEYHARKTGSADSAYSSGSNGAECSGSMPRRPSPLQAHSQASPIGHATSPAYPIYNSPSAVSQVTPPSPLDVSVSRASGVAYPSVITRADGRWEGEARVTSGQSVPARGKYPSGYAVETQPNQRGSERQQTYFEATNTSEVSVACRGDPMSIVKTLQNCNTVPVDTIVKVEERIPPKSSQKNRRKSGDKGAETVAVVAAQELTAGRVPPPAHHNTAGPVQQQNGSAYLEFERWNLPPPKMYSGHAQHQPLMVPHPHHPPPPLPYFAPFHIAPGHHPHSQEFHSSVEITPADYGDATGFHHQTEVKEENPKVIVPDIEEELGYLSQTAHAQVVMQSQHNGTPATTLPPTIKHPEKKLAGDPNSGFMASYLKFLQGERDTSPPPPSRKAMWSRHKAYVPEVKPVIPPTNSSVSTSAVTTPASAVAAKVTTPIAKKGNEKPYNPDDDPRFFPLPKSGTKRKLDDSDSSGEDGKKQKKSYAQLTTVTSAQLAQLSSGHPASASTTPTKKHGGRSSSVSVKTPTSNSKKRVEPIVKLPASDPLFVPPRRETSRRKAKDKTAIKTFLENQAVDEEHDVDDPDFVDSDADPVWIPKVEDEDDKGRKKKPRNILGKNFSLAKRRPADDLSSSDEEISKEKSKRGRAPKKHVLKDVVSAPKEEPKKPVELTTELDVINRRTRERDKKDKDKMELTGEFVVMKSDLHEEYPPIWRIDGKTLLQKYEPFDENGQTLYRNISTYSGWNSQNKHIYITVPVKFRVQSRMETIVELMKEEMMLEDPELMERVMKDLEKYQDSFEVYIQTLISQALDANFLTEILQEQDDYFLSNVKTIDEVTEDHCRRLLNVTRWKSSLLASIKTYPALNVTQDIAKELVSSRLCVGCDKNKASMRIQVYGQPYNSVTLDSCEPNTNAVVEKDFFLCSSCGWRITLFSKATHQKYLMFIECAKKVAEKREADANKDTTLILNELLADEPWLSQLFLEVRTSWAEIEKVEHISCESNKNILQNAVASAGIS